MTLASGFLEAEGYVAIFNAVDAMTKATNVTVRGVVKLGGGLVAVSVTGDLATVEEAIAVGAEAAKVHAPGRHRFIVFANPSEPVEALALQPGILV
jgi:ethanolamine utilization protein EutM